jgi:hypothetical protein
MSPLFGDPREEEIAGKAIYKLKEELPKPA